jgi:stearoyl-CoA desaturase (delta-9 desaturase)
MDRTGSARAGPVQASPHERAIILLTIFAPLVATTLAVVLLWSRGVSWIEVWLCVGFYLVSLFGVTMGYHRLFTHRSFKCAAPIRWALGIAGSMAAQGPVFYWVGSHRRHHQHSDDAGDPHSPHAHGGHGAAAVLRGWWHAHVGWMLAPEPQNYFRLVADLMRDPVAAAVNRTYLVWVLAGIALPGVIGGVASGTWAGAATGALWGGLVRLFLVHHVTWSINSVCHLWGGAPFMTKDESRNHAVCGVLALGEGWHNNHHAFPSSARHGLRWWQLDATWLAIRALRRLGLAWDVRLPSAEELARARR